MMILNPIEQKVIKALLNNKEEEFAIKTGFNLLDEATKGLRLGNAYLFAGLEKSGKTSLVLNIVLNLIKKGMKVGYISTEQNSVDLFKRIRDIRGLDSDQLEQLKELKTELVSNFAPFLLSADDSQMYENNKLSLARIERHIEKIVSEDQVKIVFVDNLTTFALHGSISKQGWEILADSVKSMIDLSKRLDIIVGFVIHVKPSTTFTLTPEGIRQIIKMDKPEEVFEESVVVVKRPTLADVYGGGGALSQISGAFLLWRPFQKFQRGDFQEQCQLILDSQRYSKSGVSIPMSFEQETGKFEELDLTVEDVRQIFQ